jgi:hypothetical protein
MTASKAIGFSSSLVVLIGSSLCPSAARAAGADAVRHVGQTVVQAQAGSRAGQHMMSARTHQTSRPSSRREAMAKRRLQRQRAADAWRGQQSRPSPHETANPNPRS